MDNSERFECGFCEGEGSVRYAVGDVEHAATCRQCDGEGWRWGERAEANAALAECADVDADLAEALGAITRYVPTDDELDAMEREFAHLFADNDNARVA